MSKEKTNSSFLEETVSGVLKDSAPGTVYLVAVSGGADSVAMLYALRSALAAVGKSHKQTLRCIHIEHGIRLPEESRGDADYVRELCRTLQVPCCVAHIPPGKIAQAAKRKGCGIEAAARMYRHRIWNKQAARLEAHGKKVRILTAHTRDDLLETALMRILRGAGPAGLAAMPMSRGRILRPLITLSRSEVRAYLAEKNIAWREDSTNADTRFLRNKVRHSLVPQLDQFFPQWKTTLASLAETQSLAADFIRDEAVSRIKWQAVGRQLADHQLSVSAETFFAQPTIIREEALFQGIDRLLHSAENAVSVKRANVRRFAAGEVTAADLGAVPDSGAASKSEATPDSGCLRAINLDGRIILQRKKKQSYESGFALLLKQPGLDNLEGEYIVIRSNGA